MNVWFERCLFDNINIYVHTVYSITIFLSVRCEQTCKRYSKDVGKLPNTFCIQTQFVMISFREQNGK